jgi:hypothetical protein
LPHVVAAVNQCGRVDADPPARRLDSALRRILFSDERPNAVGFTCRVTRFVSGHQEDPTDAQPVFIFGFARSGTTLLQRILNSYDDVLIWGEHVGFLRDVANAYYRVWRNPAFFASTVALQQALADPASLTRWQAWMNWVGEDDWTRLYRGFVESIFVPDGLPGKRFWGWKEVHYTASADDLTISFLFDTFPNARYVFLVRSGFNNMASFNVVPQRRDIVAWKHEGCDRWRETMQSFRAWHDSGRVESFWIRYEDLIQGEGEILRLLDHMGKRFGEDQQAVVRAEAARGSSFDTALYNERWKELSLLRLGVAQGSIASLNRELGYENPHVPILARMAGRAVAPLLTLAYFATRISRALLSRRRDRRRTNS